MHKLGTSYYKDFLNLFAEEVPENSEVVVDYKAFLTENLMYGFGTALVPKKKN